MDFTNAPLQPRVLQFPRLTSWPMSTGERLLMLALAIHAARTAPQLPPDLGLSSWWGV
ncbi:hypothetical protein [Mycolicibacterium fortuitum]|uniref:hypothetical protein n=1 Tax=Mycolicibacterium fortuitum TaxID=1766 RepID=UPI000A9DAC4B|nr:hypothetical protein [Mycolicibacterium fortuitum]